MRDSQRHYKALLETYRAVYETIGVNFDSLDKEPGFNKNYVVQESIQNTIVNEVLDKKQFCELEKRAIISAYCAGCAPRTI